MCYVAQFKTNVTWLIFTTPLLIYDKGTKEFPNQLLIHGELQIHKSLLTQHIK